MHRTSAIKSTSGFTTIQTFHSNDEMLTHQYVESRLIAGQPGMRINQPSSKTTRLGITIVILHNLLFREDYFCDVFVFKAIS